MKKSEALKPMKWREAVEFLIRFARIEDPEELRPGDRLNFIDDLRRYFENVGEGKLARELAEAEAKPANLKDAIEAVRELFNAVVDRKRIPLPQKEKITIIFDGSRLGDERGVVFRDGSLRDAMADTAADDLEDAEPWQICRCRECRKLFLAGRKGQIYCSHPCANAVAARQYRAANAPERAKRERARYQRRKQPINQEPEER